MLFGRRGSCLSRTASQMGDTAARADTGTFTDPSIRWLMKLREYFGPDLFNLSGQGVSGWRRSMVRLKACSTYVYVYINDGNGLSPALQENENRIPYPRYLERLCAGY